MKTRDHTDTETISNLQGSRRRRSWLTSAVAVLVVALVVGLSVVVFAQLRQQHNHVGTHPGVPSGKWESVLNGYTVTSIVAARNNPAVLYACGTKAQPGGASNSTSVPNIPFSYTILRSTDLGTHWQDLGSTSSVRDTCQIAVNPANENDVYTAGMNANGQGSMVLRHSSDGGKTWTDTNPSLSIPSVATPLTWNVLHITIEGNHLFGIAAAPFRGGPQPVSPALPKSALFAHVVTSVDGGHTWTILDAKLPTPQQSTRDYAVDPASTSSVYELVGPALGPIRATESPAQGQGYPTAIAGGLYKTTDNGATWQLLRQNLPYGTQIHLANSHIIYVGGSASPIPYILRVPTLDPAPANTANSFHLQVSRDGGANWQDVPQPPLPLIQSWQVDSDGHVYVYGGMTYTPTQGTPIRGTAIPSGPPVKVPPTGGFALGSELQPATTPPPVTVSLAVLRYDPTTNAWQQMTTAPATGNLLTVTPANSNGGAVLWFMGLQNGKMGLYRYVV